MKKTFIKIFCLSLLITSTCTLAFAADAAKGKAMFAERCASCHGAMGEGDGPVAAALPPESKPRNLKEGTMKFAVDAAKFKELMQKGGAPVGLNPLMPGAPGTTDEQIDDLYAYVKSLHK
jgi:cytochrome c oxidase cbb3-type subunit 2